MKKGWILLLLGLPSLLQARPNLLSYEWKLRVGDDAAWASPDYPDSGWREYNLGISSEGQGLSGDETAWLKQDFRALAAMKPAGLRCDLHIQAEEVQLYLNGRALPLQMDNRQAASVLLPEALVRWGGLNHLALRIKHHAWTGGEASDHLEIRPESGPAPSASVDAAFPRTDHVFNRGEDIRVPVEVRPEGCDHLDGRLRLWVRNEFHRVVGVQECDYRADKDAKPLSFHLNTLPAGFYQMVLRFSAPGVECQRVRCFAVDPTGIQCPPSPPADLATFWSRAKAELAAVPPEFKMVREEALCTARHAVYTASMKSVDGVTLRAWYVVPVKAGPHPALLHVPGYSVAMRPEWFMGDDDLIHLGLDIRGHGRSADVVNPGFGTLGFVGKGILSPETYIYRGAYLDCLRGLDFLCSRPEVDAKRIAVEGGSQGGGLSLTTAALAPSQIRACATGVPFLGDFEDHVKVRSIYAGEMEQYLTVEKKGTWSDLRHTMSYVNTSNLAERIQCPVLMGSGLLDDDCPAHINFAVFNNLKCPREYIIYPDSPHLIGEAWNRDYRRWLRHQLGLMTQP